MTNSFADLQNTNIKSDDRILILRPIDGKPTSSTGLVDRRLFNGENTLHALHDTRRRLWSLKYDKGGLPQPLKQQWTKFSALLTFVKKYFKSRNVEIIEIIE